MGSMLARPVVQKNRSWVRVATGMYLLRVSSISSSVCSASATFAWREKGEGGREGRERGKEEGGARERGGRKGGEGERGGREGGREGKGKGRVV